VVEAIDRIPSFRGSPRAICVDNGPEFISTPLDRWACGNGVALDFFQAGTPTARALVEAFNGRFRDECLKLTLCPDTKTGDAHGEVGATR